MSLEKTKNTYNNDFDGNGEGQLMAVACTQGFHHNQNNDADQSEHQRCNVGIREATYDISKSL